MELLKPVQALRRTYRNLKTGQEITVSVIACGQTRDLIGHEPGICFVGQGWKKSRQLNAEWQTDRGQVNGRYYRFRVHRGGVSATNTVTSVLVVPGGESTGDTRDVAEAASDFRKNPFGALAIQMQSTSSFDDTVWQSVSSQFLKMLQPAMLSYHSCLQEGEAE